MKISAFPAIHAMQGAVSFRLDWNGLSLVYSGDTKPNMFMVENSQNVDILIHETFLPAKIFAKKTGMSDVVASNVVNAFHTPPRSAGQIFSMTEPRLGVMFHTMMDVETIRPVFDDLRITYQGPTVLTQDFTVFNITKDAIVIRQALVDEAPWPTMSQESTEAPIEESTIEPLPEWLVESEVPVEGINTEVQKQ